MFRKKIIRLFYLFPSILWKSLYEENLSILTKSLNCNVIFQCWLFKLIKFSNLATDKDVNLSQTITNLWNVILAQHPKTKDIFLEGKAIDFKNDSTYKKIVDKLYKFDFESIEADIQGEAYEEVIKDVMTGKVLGQYFTPPNIKNIMIEQINPKVKKSGKIETIFDPAMGTGGFLISSIRHIIKLTKMTQCLGKKVKIHSNNHLMSLFFHSRRQRKTGKL